MQITFNTQDVSAKEAAGLAALLVTLHGDAVLAALEDVDRVTVAIGDRSISGSLANLKALETTGEGGGGYSADADARAADGHPMPAETNAAEAFGAAPKGYSDTQIAAATGDLDAAGTPWDERIHSGSRGTNKDGTWTRRRNTSDETFDTVMAELKGGGHQAPGNAPTPPNPPSGGTSGGKLEQEPPLVDDGTRPSPPETAPAAPPPPPPAAPAAPPAPSASAAPITFPTLMVKITKAQGAGQITKATVDGFIKELGATSMAQLASQPDKLAELNKLVDTVLGNG